MPIEDADYFIKVVKFPIPVPAFVHWNAEDDTYIIFINEDYSFDAKLDGYIHELWHILHDDFYGDKDISEIEPQLKGKL